MKLFQQFKKTPSFKDQIYVADKQLSPKFCEACIDKFESDPCIYSGITARGHAVDVKQSDDLTISQNDRWNKEDAQVASQLNKNLHNFYTSFKNKFNWWNPMELHDTGYQIQRTYPNGFYTWHPDVVNSTRVYTFIFYLNDIEDGGYTEFIDGTRIQPKAGRFLLFPSTEIYVHRGVAPKNEIKYILTGWLHREFDGEKLIQGNWHNLITPEPHEDHMHISLTEGEEVDIGNNNAHMILN